MNRNHEDSHGRVTLDSWRLSDDVTYDRGGPWCRESDLLGAADAVATSAEGRLSLQVAVHLDAVVARVGHYHTALLCDGDSLWAVQRVCRRVDVRQERPLRVKYLSGENSNND